jgi:hypothetical protein
VSVLLVPLVPLVLLGCTSGGDGAAGPDRPTGASTVPATTTTTAAAHELSECPNRTSGTSNGVFDPSTGRYAAQSLATGPDRELRFDIVQWLSGEDANRAYFLETGDDSGAPNDYYIRNERQAIDRAYVAEDASILVHRADGYAGSLHEVAFDAIPTDIPSRTFWLTFENDVISEICHQYRP